MLRKVQSFIDIHQLLTAEKPVLVGVSGGADSVALLHVLYSLGYPCVVAHCNFHLRGEESNRDEQFVVELVKKFQFPFYKTDFDTVAYSKENGISIEMAARDLRYAWFRKIMTETGAQAIAVAHHADDSIETLLMNLVRGTGLRGLTGIPYRNGDVVRPLLEVSRAEIENYLSVNGLSYVNDSTNDSTDYHRNKIRNQVIPLLEEINPSVRQTLYESLSRFDDTYEIYRRAVDDIMNKAVVKDNEEIRINIESLKEQPAINTVLFEILYSYGFSSHVIEQIVSSLNYQSGKVFFSDSYTLLKDRNELILAPKEEKDSTSYYINEGDSELTQPIKLSLRKLKKTPDFEISKDKGKIHVDWDKLKFPLELRHWREGDVFHPFGMKGQKKVSDFFTDIKLNRIEKEQCWLLLSENKIVWVIGLRLDDRFRVKDSTQNILEITL